MSKIETTLNNPINSAGEWELLLENAHENAEVRNSFERRPSNSIESKINTDKHIAIVFSGDWHIGAEGVNYQALKDMIQTVKETENMYICTVGDLIENTFQFHNQSTILDQVIHPKQQVIMLEGIIREFIGNEKLICGASGNHEDKRFEKYLGYSTMDSLFAGSHYFQGKGIVFLKVGDIEYSITVMHKARSKSKLNLTLGQMREFQYCFPSDIIACGHYHSPVIQWHPKYLRDSQKGIGGETVFVQCGTYKTKDLYAERGFDPGMIADPVVVLNPKTKEMTPFPTVKRAKVYLEAVNNS